MSPQNIKPPSGVSWGGWAIGYALAVNLVAEDTSLDCKSPKGDF
jgi:hypothetical protein